MKLIYPAIFTPFDEGTGYTVEVPDLPGCVSEGDTLPEAIEMAEDAASGWILCRMEEGESYPAPSDVQSVAVPGGSFLSLLALDMNSYAEKYGTHAVRKNITIPAWQDTFVQKNGLSLSQIMQESLLKLAMDFPKKQKER